MNRTRMIYEELVKRLDAGEYPPESEFHAESQLAEEFQVSKLMINKVVAMIAETGRLIRGKSRAGTHVTKHHFQSRGNLFYIGPLTPYSIGTVSGFQAECMTRGYLPVVLSPNDEEIAHCLLMLNSDKAGGMVSMLLGILPPVGDLNMFFLDYPMRHTVPRGQRQTGAGPDSRNKILTHGRHMTPEGFLHRFPGSDLPDHPPEGRLVPKPGLTIHVIKQINVISAPVEKCGGISVDDFRFVMNGFCQFMRTG